MPYVLIHLGIFVTFFSPDMDATWRKEALYFIQQVNHEILKKKVNQDVYTRYICQIWPSMDNCSSWKRPFSKDIWNWGTCFIGIRSLLYETTSQNSWDSPDPHASQILDSLQSNRAHPTKFSLPHLMRAVLSMAPPVEMLGQRWWWPRRWVLVFQRNAEGALQLFISHWRQITEEG